MTFATCPQTAGVFQFSVNTLKTVLGSANQPPQPLTLRAAHEQGLKGRHRPTTRVCLRHFPPTCGPPMDPL
eukprot:1175880-Prorocentrum_minimum.AAC.4